MANSNNREEEEQIRKWEAPKLYRESRRQERLFLRQPGLSWRCYWNTQRWAESPRRWGVGDRRHQQHLEQMFRKVESCNTLKGVEKMSVSPFYLSNFSHEAFGTPRELQCFKRYLGKSREGEVSRVALKKDWAKRKKLLPLRNWKNCQSKTASCCVSRCTNPSWMRCTFLLQTQQLHRPVGFSCFKWSWRTSKKTWFKAPCKEQGVVALQDPLSMPSGATCNITAEHTVSHKKANSVMHITCALFVCSVQWPKSLLSKYFKYVSSQSLASHWTVSWTQKILRQCTLCLQLLRVTRSFSSSWGLLLIFSYQHPKTLQQGWVSQRIMYSSVTTKSWLFYLQKMIGKSLKSLNCQDLPTQKLFFIQRSLSLLCTVIYVKEFR